ncbi:MAG: hypothetical protein ACTSUE_11360 [Promethearchaeota archaeon]
MVLMDLSDFLKENFVSIITFIVIFFSIIVLMSIWVYRNAAKHYKKPLVWFFTSLFLGFIGFFIYLTKKRGKLRNWLEMGIVFSRISTGIAFFLGLLAYGIFPLMGLGHGLATIQDIWPSISLVIFVVGTGFIVAWAGASNRIGQIAAFLVDALIVLVLWNMFVGDFGGPYLFSLYIVNISLFALIAFGGIVSVINFIAMSYTDRNNFNRRWGYRDHLAGKMKRHKRELAVGMSLAIVFSLTGIISLVPTTFARTITITPQDYRAEIAFWGRHEFSRFNDTVKQQLNDHNATIVLCHPPNVMTSAGESEFISDLTLWRDNYPRVRFIASVVGFTRINDTGDNNSDFFYNTFPYDGSAEGVILWSKKYIEVAEANNLTNFIGVNTDQESPDDKLRDIYGLNINPDVARNQDAVEQYNAFFDWRDANYPDMTITTTMGNKPVIDIFDGDQDIQINDRSNVFNVDGWDEIAPMTYRSGCDGTAPYGDLPRPKTGDEGRPSSWVYTKLKFLSEALMAVDGNTSRLGIYLGITNCTSYGRDVEQYDMLGNFEGYGYDQLVKDALIAKHFGSKIITLFLLWTTDASADPDPNVMGGVFDSYGAHFLDDFMGDINGVNSTTPFTIYMVPDASMLDDFNQDLLMNLARPGGMAFVLAIVAGIVILSILMHPEAKRFMKMRVGIR